VIVVGKKSIKAYQIKLLYLKLVQTPICDKRC